MSELPLEPSPPRSQLGPGIVVLGRFQPLHKGHANMIIAAESWRSTNAEDQPLIIAIGSSNQPQSIRNPWTYQERILMLEVWLESSGIEAELVPIPDLEDPPNWVDHAEKYHGVSGTLFTSDVKSAELYESSGWQVILSELENREKFQGWRVRATAQMMSTVGDLEAVRSVLASSVPKEVVSLLLDNDSIRRLAFMGEGGEPVG
ncbi:MAG: hypothetical protein CMB61_04270 [Euryarchaeota archaeon]|mgnify:FL=1|nr:hypothetical protein [Euryarchaeota archaeon]